MIQTWSQWYQLVCSTELFHSWNASCLPNLVANVSHSRKTSLHHLTPGSRAVRAQQHKARCWSPWQRYIFISHTKALLTHVGSAFAEQALKYGLKRHCRAVVSWWLDVSHPIAMVSHQKQWLSVTRGTLQTDRCVAGAGGNIAAVLHLPWWKRALELCWAAAKPHQSNCSGGGESVLTACNKHSEQSCGLQQSLLQLSDLESITAFVECVKTTSAGL